MPDKMNFSFLDPFRLKGQIPKVFTPKNVSKQTKLQEGIIFEVNIQQQVLCILYSKQNFQLYRELDTLKALCQAQS